jgi:hypothetical protein
MQVKDLIETLNSCYKPTDELVVLFYSKDEFDFEPDDEMVLTDEGWLKIVKVMHESGGLESADQIISETISDMAGEYGDVVEDSNNND